MPKTHSQSGQTPSDFLVLINNENHSNLDRLLSTDIIHASQPPLFIPFHSTTTTTLIVNIPHSTHTFRIQDVHPRQQHQQSNHRTLNERQQLQAKLWLFQEKQQQNQQDQQRLQQRLLPDKQRLKP